MAKFKPPQTKTLLKAELRFPSESETPQTVI